MLNLLFALYICLIPLILLIAFGEESRLKLRQFFAELRTERRQAKRPVAARKLAYNAGRRAQTVYVPQILKQTPVRQTEHFDLSGLQSRNVSYFPGTQLSLICENLPEKKAFTARSVG